MLAPGHFVASLYIAHSGPHRDARQRRDEPVDPLVPPRGELAVTVAVTRSIDDIRVPFDDWLEQRPEVLWIVLRVRILDHDDIAGHMTQRRADRRPFAAIGIVPQNKQIRIGLVVIEDTRRAVNGTVVDNNDLHRQTGRLQGIHDTWNGAALIEDWHDDA